jgi:hypothetical protein
MSLETFLELVPNNLNICREGGPMMVPPDTCKSLQLMSSIRCFHTFHQPDQVKPLFYGVQPFIGLKWFFCLLEDRRLCVHEVLETTILIRFGSLADMVILRLAI